LAALTGEQQTLHGEPARFAHGYTEVAPGTWAWMQPNGGLGESNSGLITDGEHVLVVDSLWDLALTAEMLEAAKDIVPHRPEILFNSHSDGDHVWGNQLFDGARIISTDKARDLMTLDPPKSMRAMRSAGLALGAIGKLPLPFIGRKDFGKLPRLPLTEMGHEMEPFEWGEIKLTLPDETFSGHAIVEVGSRQVELVEVGPAHTEGDAVAWVPDQKVCFAADILFIGGTPIMWAGPISSWIAALDTVSALGAEKYVPGHGPVCGQTDVDLVRDYFAWIVTEGIPQLDRNVTPLKAAQNMLFSDEFRSSPWAEWDDPARLVVTLSTEHFKRSGGKGHLHGGARSRVITQMQLTKTAMGRKR
jgi:glyoxylase-like metal-dependent hydrolase (beta-lactamase superfamily II)